MILFKFVSTFGVLLIYCCVLASTKDISSSKGRKIDKILGDEDNSKSDKIKIRKCCASAELLIDKQCTLLTKTNESQLWQPEFESDGPQKDFRLQPIPDFKLEFGYPVCRSHEKQWDVLYYETGSDKLVILQSGKLRHYIVNDIDEIEKAKEQYGIEFLDLNDKQTKSIHYDYPFGHYCIDKAVFNLHSDKKVVTYAMICVPEVSMKWENPEFLMKKAIDPAFHTLAIISYIVVAIVYFILPQLRDLVGNIISSLSLCLIINQVASLVRIFTHGYPLSFMIADSVMYISQLAAFLWLNTLGYYVWNTFRSRNVYLRVTDTRKYCCYSTYVWGSTIAIASTALFAHFTLETKQSSTDEIILDVQETVGRLGLSVIFASIAFTVLIDLSFVLTTINRMQRMIVYGRIHHKMKYTFRMYVLMYGIMTLGWISTLFSQLPYTGILYLHIIMNALQGILILYVCVFGQKRVMFLLSKTFSCLNSGENPDGFDWGEEMTAFNAGY